MTSCIIEVVSVCALLTLTFHIRHLGLYVVVSVIPDVLSKKQTIEGRDVHTDLFYPYLSNVSTSSARRQPVVIPQDIVILLEKSKTKFVRHSGKFRAKLESELSSSKCGVVWPCDDDSGRLVLRCTLTNDDIAADAELARSWTDKCQSVAEQHVAGIHRAEEKVCGEIWERFLQETSSAAGSEMKESYVEQDKDNFSLTCVGPDDVITRSFQCIRNSAGCMSNNMNLIVNFNFNFNDVDLRAPKTYS